MDSDPDRARALFLQGLRGHHPGARTLPRHPARLGRPEPARHGAVREVRAAPAIEPAGRALRAGRRAAQPVDAGRSGGHLRGRAGAAVPADRETRHGGGTAPWRRHRRPGAGQGQDEHGPRVGLRARRPAVRRRPSPGGPVPLLARPPGRAPAGASGELDRDAAGRRLRGLRQALRRRAQAGADHRGRVLGPRAEKVLRAGRHRGRGAPEGSEEGDGDRAHGARGRAAHGRAVRHRAGGERPPRGRAAGGATRALRAHRGSPGGVDACRAGPPAGRRPGGQGDELHARPLAVLRPLPRGRVRMHVE